MFDVFDKGKAPFKAGDRVRVVFSALTPFEVGDVFTVYLVEALAMSWHHSRFELLEEAPVETSAPPAPRVYQPDDKVRCVDASDRYDYPTGLERGAIYIVKEFRSGMRGGSVTLVEHTTGIGVYDADRFEPEDAEITRQNAAETVARQRRTVLSNAVRFHHFRDFGTLCIAPTDAANEDHGAQVAVGVAFIGDGDYHDGVFDRPKGRAFAEARALGEIGDNGIAWAGNLGARRADELRTACSDGRLRVVSAPSEAVARLIRAMRAAERRSAGRSHGYADICRETLRALVDFFGVEGVL